MNALRPLSLRFAMLLVGVILPLLVLEVGLRVENRLRKGIPFALNPSERWDSELGWTGKEHRFEPLSFDPLLVIGDSFTDGLDVARDQMWFAQLAQRYPERGVIAYGGLGYGTLQQLRVLQGYHSRGVRPSLVVLQLCSNDILNNLFELEKKSLLQRPPAPRPYLEGDMVKLRFPRDNDWLFLPLVSVSRIAYRASTRWDSFVADKVRAGRLRSVEQDIQGQGFAFTPFRKAVGVTHILLERFKQEAGAAQLVFMLVEDAEPYSTALRDIARKLNVPLLIPTRESPLGPSDRLADGTHLNSRGNEILGRAFVKLLSERGLLP
jgi:lysophospholipase L1-like esterase